MGVWIEGTGHREVRLSWGGGVYTWWAREVLCIEWEENVRGERHRREDRCRAERAQNRQDRGRAERSKVTCRLSTKATEVRVQCTMANQFLEVKHVHDRYS